MLVEITFPIIIILFEFNIKMKKDILDEFKELMEKDVSVTLDFEIFHDLNKYNIISDKDYKDFLESNQKRYKSIYH